MCDKERVPLKGVAIFDAIGTNLQQKPFVLMNKNVYYERCHKV
jgi:hypothetical protein